MHIHTPNPHFISLSQFKLDFLTPPHADINNEKAARNAQYARNLASLAQLVLYRFANDTTGRVECRSCHTQAADLPMCAVA